VVLFQGLSAATAVILGNEMGAGKLKRAEGYAKNFFILQFIVTLLAMAVCYLIREPVIGMYRVLLIDTSGVWLIGIPMAFIGGLWLKQPIYVVYAMVMLEEVYKALLGTIRYRQKKWLKNLTVEMTGQA